MPKYAEPEASQELRNAIRQLIARSGLTEASRRLNEGKPAFTRDEIERVCSEVKLSREQRVALLGLRGDVVIVQPDRPIQVVEMEQQSATLTRC